MEKEIILSYTITHSMVETVKFNGAWNYFIIYSHFFKINLSRIYSI